MTSPAAALQPPTGGRRGALPRSGRGACFMMKASSFGGIVGADAAAAPVVKKERVKVDFTTDIASKALIESIAPVMDDFKIENLLEVLPQIIQHVQTFKNLTGLQKKNMIVSMLRHLLDITDGPGDDELWDPIVKRLLPGMVDMLVKVDQGKLKLNTSPCRSVLGIFSCCRP